MDSDFAHIVTVDKPDRTLRIERVYPDGRREPFTTTRIPKQSKGSEDTFRKFALQLGENLLLDSPAARELLNLSMFAN